MRRQTDHLRGFTLVELMIVVAIIALLAAIAIPNLTRARVTANHTAAKATLKALTVALEGYRNTYATYPETLTRLETPPDGGPSFFTFSRRERPGERFVGWLDIESAWAGGAPPPPPGPSAENQFDRQGYHLSYTPGDAVGGRMLTYTLTASPQAFGATGRRGFFVDASGVIRETAEEASAAEAPTLANTTIIE